MRTLIVLIILILTGVAANCQVVDYKVNPVITIEVDTSLVQSMDRLVVLFHKYQIDKKHLNKIKGVYRTLYYNSAFGYTQPDTGIITINSDLPLYLPSLKTYVLYHEVAHILLGKLHDPSGPYLLRAGHLVDVENLFRYWNYYENQYMNYLKTNLH